MTNKDKFLRDGVDIEKLVNDIVMFEIKEIGWAVADKEKERIKRFFNAPFKHTLTESEKVILRNIPTNFKYIHRDKVNRLIVTEDRQASDEPYGCEILIFSHLFLFIKERRRIRNRGVVKR